MKAKLLLACSMAAAALPLQADPLDQWLNANAAAVSSVELTHADDSDLEPIAAAIGNSRVVLLGEPSHGAGSSFAAKARIIKFLHRRMGFDVLAWESGLLDVRLAQAALRTERDPAVAAQAGILAIWSRAAEARPLFEYARTTLATSRPLDMAGFDIQASAPKTGDVFAAELRAFITVLRDPALRQSALSFADTALSMFQRIQARDGPRPTRADLEALQRGTQGLLILMRERRQAFEQVHGAISIAFFQRALANLEAAGINHWQRRCCEALQGTAALRQQSEVWNRRDQLMAANLRWLIEERHAGRKVLVWAHNAHLMRAHFAADWQGIHRKPQPGGMTPMGALLADWLGDQVYSMAFTTYQGEEAWANGQKRGSIAPAPEGSLESRLHALAKPIVFLDLRAARGVRSHPLRTPTTLRISGYGQPTGRYGNDEVADITQAFDGVFFIDRMAPATRLPD
jgi:erythromycin esterase